jgi:hypothetical protein
MSKYIVIFVEGETEEELDILDLSDQLNKLINEIKRWNNR